MHIQIEGNKKFYSCYIEEDLDDFLPIGYGRSVREALDDLKVSCYELQQECKTDKKIFADTKVLDKCIQRFDLRSLFNYYPIDKYKMAKDLGIKNRELDNYINHKHIDKSLIHKIQVYINNLGELLAQTEVNVIEE